MKQAPPHWRGFFCGLEETICDMNHFPLNGKEAKLNARCTYTPAFGRFCAVALLGATCVQSLG